MKSLNLPKRAVSILVLLLLLAFSAAVSFAPYFAVGEPYQAAGLGAWTQTLYNNVGGDFTDVVAHPTNGNVLFACREYLYRSDDGGATWSAALTPDRNFSCMAISPAAPDIVLLGGYDEAFLDYRVYRYENSTGQLSEIGYGLPGLVQDIAVGTTSLTGPAYIATGGEVWRSNPIGSGFSALNSGLPTTPYGVVSIAVSPSDNGDVLAGTWQQGIYKLNVNGTAWDLSSSGFATGSSPGSYAAAKCIEYEPRYGDVVLVGTNGAGLYRSVDSGASWTWSSYGIDYDTPHGNGFAFDPGGSGLVYASVPPMGVYCSPDFGENWHAVSSSGLQGGAGMLQLHSIAMTCDLTELLVIQKQLPNPNPPYTASAVYQLELTNYYFAEGYTGPGFEEWLCLANFSTNPSNMAVMYIYPDQPVRTKLYEVSANARFTANINIEAETSGDVSIRVVSDTQAVAERPIYFDYGGWCPGGHDVVGARETLKEWYFAEGYTGPGFDEWLCMANFGTGDAVATVKYIYPDKPAMEKDYLVAAGRRSTLSVNAESETVGDVSIYVNSTQPIVAERPMYFNYRGEWAGGHDVLGANAPQGTLYFAEGYTGEGFEEWLCMMNPSNSGAANVNVNYYFGSGGSLQAYYYVEAEKRLTVNVNEEAARMGHGGEEVSLEILSNGDIVAERPMYFNYRSQWPGGHDVMGASQTATEFYFAEGYTGEGFEEWLCILVMTGSATADITYIYPDKPPLTKRYDLPGLSRTTLNINQESETTGDVSIKVTSDFPIMVERPMYFNYQGKWSGGHDVMGATF